VKRRTTVVAVAHFRNNNENMKLIKFLATAFLLLASVYTLNGQQLVRYSQYMFNGLVINPAYAGSLEATSFTAFYRNQWANIEGAPVDMSISAHGQTGKSKRIGLGGFFSNDRAGKQNHYDFLFSYSYKFPLQNGATLSTGLQGGFFLYQANLLDGDSPDQGIFDPALDFESAWGPNFGAGLYYYSDKTYIGASIPFLLNYKNPIGTKAGEDSEFETAELRKIQYLLTAGHLLELSPNLKLKPSMLFRLIPQEFEPVELDLTGSLYIKDFFMVGNSWRFNSGARPQVTVFMMSYQFTNGLRFGYAYEYSFFSDVSRYSSSHEIMIGYDIPNLTNSNNSKVLNPRYF